MWSAWFTSASKAIFNFKYSTKNSSKLNKPFIQELKKKNQIKIENWTFEWLQSKKKRRFFAMEKSNFVSENYDYFCFSGKSLNEFYWEIWFSIIMLFYEFLFIGFLRSFQFFLAWILIWIWSFSEKLFFI
jgi:hypothetical protein